MRHECFFVIFAVKRKGTQIQCLRKRTLIRILRNIFRVLLVLVIGGYVALCLYLDTPQGKRWLAGEAASRLSQHVGAKVEIGEASLGLPGHVRFGSVRLYDRADSLMLSAETLDATVSLTDLLETGKVRLRSVALLDGQAYVYKQRADTALNVQFFLDAFKSKEAPSRPTDVRISQLVVRRFGVRYDEMYMPQPAAGVFSPHHIDIRNLSASVNLPTLTDELIHLKVRQLAFDERSGLKVNNLTTELWRYKDGLKLSGFDLRMPNTHIAQRELTLAFSDDNLPGTLRTSGMVADARISTDDLAPLIPALSPLHNQLSLSTAFDITPSRIVLRGADVVSDRPVAAFRGDVQIDKDGAGLKSLVLHSETLAANIPSVSQFLTALGQPALPDIAQRLGALDYKGDLTWTRGGQTSMNGALSTSQGSVRGNVTYQGALAEGDVMIDNLRLATLLGDATMPEPLTAMAKGKLTLTNGQPQAFDGRVSLVQTVWKGRQISGITAEGHADRNHVDLLLDSRDTEASLYGKLTANIDQTTLRDISWQGEVHHFRPAAWGIAAAQDLAVAFDGTVQAAGLSQLASLDGTAQLNHLVVKGGGVNLDQRNLAMTLHPSPEGHDIDMETAYGNLSIQGPLDVQRLRAAVEGVLARAIPDFAPMFMGKDPIDAHVGNAQWKFNASLLDDALFDDILQIPLSSPNGVELNGTLAEGTGRSDITLKADTLCYDGQGFKDVTAYLQGEGAEYSLLVQTEKALAGMNLSLAAQAQTTGHELTTQVSWRDQKDVFRGELAAYTFPKREGKGLMRTELRPTEVYFKDNMWKVFGGTVLWGGDTLAVNRLYAEHESQNIVVDGAFSEGSPDSITADLNNIDLDYIFDVLNFHPVDFAGFAGGHAVLTFADKKPVVKARLDIKDFSINGGPLGRADIKGEVDLDNMIVNLDADMLDAPYGRTLVIGNVKPQENTLDLAIDSRGTNLEFLRKYIGGILHDISGRATGRSRLFGTFKELMLTGDIMADVSGDLPVLGCSYQVDSAHVVMSPGLIDIRSGKVRDSQNGTAQASGKVQHRYLGNFHYNFDFLLDHCLIYDRPRTSDLTFSSHALASGKVNIKGQPGRLDCDIDVRPERGSNFRYHMDLPDDYTGSTLLNIRPAPELEGSGKGLADIQGKEAESSSSDVYMNLNLDMQPDVPLTVIMDEKTGDNIMVRGSGPLRATYYNKGQFNLYGTYTLTDGVYKMTIQDIIHKDFRFQPGGTVNFNGKPFEGVMDMQAIYTVHSASLSDLNLTSGVSQNGVRVNCLLNFSGQVQDPKVRFDLDMPTVNQDVKQMVRSLISTEEEMNRQVLYLLAIGRFFTYDYAETEATQSQGETAMNSFLSNTLSGQLNNFISSAMGQSNWTFGTNVSTGNYGWEDVGVEGQIGGRLLNNRLLINGNFGYRNSVTQQSGNFVGDFDVQYLLTPGGSVRLKAYNETNDRYFTKNSLTTQGVGVVVQRSFNKFSDLFRRKKKDKTTEQQ